MYVGIGAVLATGVAILTIAVLFLQTARRYVDLTERRLELLQEGEAFLLKLAQRQGQALEGEAERREKVPERVRNPRGRQQGEEFPGSRPPEGLDAHVQETPYTGSSSEVEDEEQRRKRTPKANPAPARPKDSAPRLGVQVPHPDDDVPGRGWNNSPARFFQKCYDRYLEHYEGYVRLAERLHQSGPTVSQTVARMERDGLLTVQGDRHLELTEEGHVLVEPAHSVVRSIIPPDAPSTCTDSTSARLPPWWLRHGTKVSWTLPKGATEVVARMAVGTSVPYHSDPGWSR